MPLGTADQRRATSGLEWMFDGVCLRGSARRRAMCATFTAQQLVVARGPLQEEPWIADRATCGCSR